MNGEKEEQLFTKKAVAEKISPIEKNQSDQNKSSQLKRLLLLRYHGLIKKY